MKICHVITKLSFDGGPSITVPRLCQEIEKLGHEVRYVTAEGGFHGGRSDYNTFQWADVVHLTGIYNAVVPFTLWFCRRYNKPLVWSPRGGWQRFPGSRKMRLKQFIDALYRRLAPTHTVMHATSELEAQSIMAVINRPVRVIGNGVDVPETPQPRNKSEDLRVLYLGRIDPKKGIEKVILAMSCFHACPIKLRIAGTGNQEYMTKLRELAAGNPNIYFTGHVPHERLPLLFANTDVTIVPSIIESFGQVVVESLAHSVPVIASTGVPFTLHDKGCGVSVKMERPPIIELMNFMILKQSRPDIIEAMGKMGREWMKEEFSWSQKAEQMVEAYQFASSVA